MRYSIQQLVIGSLHRSCWDLVGLKVILSVEMSGRKAHNAGQARNSQPAATPDRQMDVHAQLAAAQQLLAMLVQPTSVASQSMAACSYLIDELIADIAQEAHREANAYTGVASFYYGIGSTSPPMLPPAPKRPKPLPAKPGIKGPVDIYGQSHPAKATDCVTCRSCGRQVQAGSFAPHLDKCMGKGRAAARAASRRMQGQT